MSETKDTVKILYHTPRMAGQNYKASMDILHKAVEANASKIELVVVPHIDYTEALAEIEALKAALLAAREIISWYCVEDKEGIIAESALSRIDKLFNKDKGEG